MKNASLISFIALFLQLFTVALGRITYDGLALTSIDVIPSPTKEGYVRFSGGKLGKANDDTATFLTDIKQINDKDEGGERLFEAKKLTVSEAKAIINNASADGEGKPLFCVHGFNVQPGTHLKNFKDSVNGKFNQGKFMPVPVIWPSKGGLNNYWGDRDNSAPGAGQAFKTLKRGVDSFPSKSLLCHSMGNFVLRHAADANFRFDNIFMCAADVRHDLFKKKFIGGNNRRREDGLKICRMLTNKNKGKVHIVYNAWDGALNAGSWVPTTWVVRIGTVGFNKRRNWRGAWIEDNSIVHDECKPCLKNFNAGALLPWSQTTSHGYLFNDDCIKYYQDNHF